VDLKRLTVDASAAGSRLDRWLAERVPELSRARVQALIEDGRVRVEGRARFLGAPGLQGSANAVRVTARI